MMESLTSDSPMITAMIADLTAISDAEASIDSETAEYRVPKVIHVAADLKLVREDFAKSLTCSNSPSSSG